MVDPVYGLPEELDVQVDDQERQYGAQQRHRYEPIHLGRTRDDTETELGKTTPGLRRDRSSFTEVGRGCVCVWGGGGGRGEKENGLLKQEDVFEMFISDFERRTSTRS